MPIHIYIFRPELYDLTHVARRGRRFRVLAENSVGVGFSCSLFPILKPIPAYEKMFAVGKKSGLKATFLTYFFLGWVDLGVGSSTVS